MLKEDRPTDERTSDVHAQAAQMLPTLQDIAYGGDYSPEQWPESVWPEDVRLMQEAGVNLVSLGIFSWAKLEPTPGEYTFDWLDRMMNLLHAGGVGVNLATATASPPPWMAKLDPNSLPRGADGIVLGVGARQQYCPSNPTYRQGAANLTRLIAERYGQHPALVAWHVNNEYGCHISECFCEQCAARFRLWLQRRYQTLAALNAAWGTTFWSQHYAQWDEISPPRRVSGLINPTQQLDWHRFSSDNILELCVAEMDVLREVTPGVPRATNFLGFLPGLDYWSWAGHQDFIATDVYPDPASPEAHLESAISYDLARSLGGGAPWALMEQTSSLVNWRPRNAVKAPGVMRLQSLQAVARGADAVMFFQWRASRAGAEKYHGAMLPHAGTDTRVHREIRTLGADLHRLRPLRGSRVEVKAALLHDWENGWALRLGSKPSDAVVQQERLTEHYRSLYGLGVNTDLAHPEHDLSSYSLVVVPNQYLLTDRAAENLIQYVEGGGTVVIGFFSGVVDEHDHIRLGGYPAPWRELLGLHIEEFFPLPEGETRRVQARQVGAQAAPTFGSDLWCDAITVRGAEVLASFTEGEAAGQPAVTRHAYGRGQAYYVGTRLDESGLDWLLARACQDAGLIGAGLTGAELLAAAPAPGVETLTRVGNGGERFVFVLNHGAQEAEVQLPPGTDLLSGQPVGGAFRLAATEAVVVQTRP